MKKYISLILFCSNIVLAQNPTSKKILINHANIHTGNQSVIVNGSVVFSDGKILAVNGPNEKISESDFDKIIDLKGKELYPGFIAPNTTLGLAEIDAVKATIDLREIGKYNPHIRSIVAYNTDSKLIDVSRTNGILLGQITPRGGVFSGTSSIVHLNAWNWQEASVKTDDGLHINWPSRYSKNFRTNLIEENQNYSQESQKILDYFVAAKTYAPEANIQKNIVFDALLPVCNNQQKLFLHADAAQDIIDAVLKLQKIVSAQIVVVGGKESYLITDFLKNNKIPVLLNRVHDLPTNDDNDYDLPFKTAKILLDNGILVGLENSGEMERMNVRNLPFLAGTCAAFGVNKEQALQLITLNTAKILGIDKDYGSIEVGKSATFFASEGDALDMMGNQLFLAFINGKAINLENHQTELAKKYQQHYKEVN